MKRFNKILIAALMFFLWMPVWPETVGAGRLKGEIYLMDENGLSLAEKIHQTGVRFSRDFKGDCFMSGYSFEARGNNCTWGTRIDCQGKSTSRIYCRGGRLLVRTFGPEPGKDPDQHREAADRDLVFLHKKNADGFAVVDVAVLDAGRSYQVEDIPFFWLGPVDAAVSLGFLKVLFEGSEDQLQKNVLAAIAMHRHPESAGFLLEIASNTGRSIELRKQAIFWLGAIKDRVALSGLKTIAARELPHALRKQLVFAFYLNGTTDAVRELIQYARRDPSASIRKNAIFWLGQKASAECVRALEDVLAGEGELEVKSSAVFAISQLEHSTAVPMLIKIARENKHPQIRKKAMFWLGETGDQRALNFFEEILLK